MRKIVLSLTLIFMTSIGFSQELKLASLFCDQMVLQRDSSIPIWGTAKPKEKITVTFAGKNKSTITNKNGKWKVNLDPVTASKNGRQMTVSGNTKIVISDILVGEVWICSGQSNMEFPIAKVPEIKSLIPFSKNIRSFEVKRTVSFKEEQDVTGKWNNKPPESAIAFAFAYFLESIGDIPIGIIHASWGSSSIEAWMPRDMTKELSYFKTIMNNFDNDTLTNKKINKILASPEGWSRKEDIYLRRQPNILYNAMIKPLTPYACKGLIWYQGERNTRYISGVPNVNKDNWFHEVSGMKEYGNILKLWAQRYRQEWQNEQMHFSIVMLPGYGKGTVKNLNIDPENPTEESWAWMRESQLKILDLPNTSIVNTIDLGDVKNIHPTDKLPIGQRLALLVAKNTLHINIIAEGPIMEKIEVLENTLIVHFKNAKGLKTNNKKPPSGFWISDNALTWKPAEASIEGKTVILSNSEIKKPLYIRYAFAGKPNVNLVNHMNLPTYPFRTDPKN